VNIDTGSFRALEARADAAGTAAADVADLGELVAGLAAETALLADKLVRITNAVMAAESLGDVMVAAERAGYARALREQEGGYEAAVRARQRRAGFQLVDGGKAARKPRKSGGAA